MRKIYKVESDILASAGEEGLARIAEDNIVYIDFKELEERATNTKDSNYYELRNVLKWTNQMMDETLYNKKQNGQIILPSGGIISWKDVPDEAEYITRCPAKTSQLKRKNKNVSFPDFLKYTITPLKSGLININHNNPDKMTINEILEKTGLDSLYGHQYILVNNQLVYKVQQELKEHNSSGRFSTTDKISLTKFNRNAQIKSELPLLRARTLEQKLCWDQLTSKDVELSFITGGSGSGKTVIAYAAAINQILGTEQKRSYNGIILFKTNDIIGEENRKLGFLPGNIFEKTYQGMKSFEDAHNLCGIDEFLPFREILLHPKKSIEPGAELRAKDKIGNLYLPAKTPAIEIEHLQFARGRTFENKIIFVDEVQNYTPFEIKQLMERTGQGCKIFLVGDPEQVDNPKLSPEFNGLVYASNKFYGRHPRISFMYFDKNFRSQSAEIIRRFGAPKALN
ncbi:PhoH family protein [Candidatus Pacearchaeota archaeon]|nr:PhoH family protein [Candidatus Pacearchaeota archaeon]